MTRRQCFERAALPFGQIAGIAQPDVADAAQQSLPLLLGAAHLVNRVVDDLDGVELVEGYGGLRQVVGDAFD